MSLRSLNKRIETCRYNMDRQRGEAVQLLNQQKSFALHQAQRVPLPLAMGVAFAGGFIAQRFFNSPAPSTLWHLYLSYRAF